MDSTMPPYNTIQGDSFADDTTTDATSPSITKIYSEPSVQQSLSGSKGSKGSKPMLRVISIAQCLLLVAGSQLKTLNRRKQICMREESTLFGFTSVSCVYNLCLFVFSLGGMGELDWQPHSGKSRF